MVKRNLYGSYQCMLNRNFEEIIQFTSFQIKENDYSPLVQNDSFQLAAKL